MYFQKERKNVLPVQRLSEQLMCGVSCVYAAAASAQRGKSDFSDAYYGCSQPSRFATGSPMGLSAPWHRGYWVCNKILGMHQCRVSEGQHCGKCTLPLFLISAPGKKDRRVGGWDVRAVMYLNTNLDLRKYEDEEEPKGNHDVGVHNRKLNIFEESIVAGGIPPRPPPHYI